MAITIPIDINAPSSGIDLAALKEELTRYAMKLVNASSAVPSTDASELYRTSPFVESLKVHTDSPVPVDLKMEDVYVG